jgi:hypothetical protein
VETRTAPQWIRETEKRYGRRHRMWVAATATLLVAMVALALGGAFPHAAWAPRLSPWCVLVLLVWRPHERARRLGAAANALNAAIARYEASPDRPESALGEADRQARETARIERIRTAPGWIRSKRRSYWLRILAWTSPALLALAFMIAAPVLRWSWALYWRCVAAFFLLLIGALARISKLVKAQVILGEAIARYEYESAAAEGDLEEADGQASGVLVDQ